MVDAKLNIFPDVNIPMKQAEEAPDGVTQTADPYNPLSYCRTCANVDTNFVPIFTGEGLEHELKMKIGKYLPITVSQEDDLPHQLCYNCATALISWDALVASCLEAEKKLKSLKQKLGFQEDVAAPDEDSISLGGQVPDNTAVDSDDEPLSMKIQALENRKNAKRKGGRERKVNRGKVAVARPLVESEIERLMEGEGTGLSFTSYAQRLTMYGSLLTRDMPSGEDLPVCQVCTILRKLHIARDKCSSCDRVAAKKDTDPEKTPRGKKLMCERCGKTLSSKISLENHKKVHMEKTMMCHVCGKGFRHRFNLTRHVRVVHEGVKDHTCGTCGRGFRSQGELVDHGNVHTAQQSVVCEQCGRVFRTVASFHTHRRAHRRAAGPAALFRCPQCGKTFTTRRSQLQHSLIHSGQKPLPCGVCGKTFRSQANLDQHARVHAAVKPFACEHCGKRFGRRDHLVIHVRSHTGEKPYVCDTCGRGFAQTNDLKKHRRTHDRAPPDQSHPSSSEPPG